MMSRPATQPFGQEGEKLAVQYLQSKGYTIIGTNWRCTDGEIDIIAQNGSMLVFVEVRTRHAATTERAFESITPRKRDKMTRLAHAYLSAHELNEGTLWRVDVIGIAIPRSGKPIIEHSEDALDW